jgi:Taurine catabolism dioxygenase TauD, TfdA family/Gamma-butyrobetaine hydroxylase-like, N-terminal
MTIAMAAARVIASPDALRIEWQDGISGEFASVWLRDNLPEDRDAHSGQRLTDVTALPAAPRIRSAAVADGQLRVVWQDEPRVATFALDWLYEHSGTRTGRAQPPARRWLEGAQLEPRRDFAWRSMAAIKADPQIRLEWLTRLSQDGIAFMSAVAPVEAGILEAITLVGRIAETNYGLVFDVRTVAEPENLAYSDRGLGLHTDNPYREPVPGFQALHTLRAAPDGGESLFADGFALAEHLRQCAPEAFAILTRTAVPFRYRSRQANLYAERPLIQLDCSGAIAAVHYNSRSIAPLRLPLDECRAYYDAYRFFGELLRESRFQLRILLGNADLVVFDNQRILHGRTGFASSMYPRHLRGCYLTRDSVYSEAALLRGQTKIGER